MTRTKRLLAGVLLAAAVAVGTTTPALANMHATSYPATENVEVTAVSTDNMHAT
ncbi:hypothetical protein GCM10010222_72530 [Streptomyces tanashiensis]|uniref:hypothetical protein n=1 Tax=Streptomyces tanashiensis TaxID=67367 RepID=UPI00167722D3|nr:hypothetical protein [Streptomyces tanashiensis]GGT20080.1 hypothetical protein GCM10010222_72530 [Streptomyces tanashiensis]